MLAVLKHFELTPHAPVNGPAFVVKPAAPHHPLTTPVFIRAVKAALSAKGHDQREYAGHSFRRGGASFAYQSGVPLHSIKQLGDWQSESYSLYVFDNDTTLHNHLKTMSQQICTFISSQ